MYVFTRRGATWTQQAYVKASNTGEAGTADTFGDGDQFGVSLALSDDGNTMAVGALTEDSASPGINGNQADNSANSAGAVYVFTRTADTWSQQAYVKPVNPGAGDMFGYTVSLNADGTLAWHFDEMVSRRSREPDDMRNGAGAITCSLVRARVVTSSLIHAPITRRQMPWRPRGVERRGNTHCCSLTKTPGMA